MAKAPAYRRRKPCLFIDVQHGLANRLRAMASAASIAQRTERELVVIWRPDHHCGARISDLLAYEGIVIEDNTADLCRKRAAVVYNYMEIESGSNFQESILADADQYAGEDLYVRSAYTLNSPLRFDVDEQIFLRALVPSGPVQALIGAVRHPNQVAVHIRMATGAGYDHLSHESPDNWPAHRHAELSAWREKSHSRHFIARLDQLIAEGKADSIFLAADLPETYALFAERYGDRLSWLPRDLFDRSALQMQYALADLLLLTSAGLFLASTGSSFSDIAQRLARPHRPFENSGWDF